MFQLIAAIHRHGSEIVFNSALPGEILTTDLRCLDSFESLRAGTLPRIDALAGYDLRRAGALGAARGTSTRIAFSDALALFETGTPFAFDLGTERPNFHELPRLDGQQFQQPRVLTAQLSHLVGGKSTGAPLAGAPGRRLSLKARGRCQPERQEQRHYPAAAFNTPLRRGALP